MTIWHGPTFKVTADWSCIFTPVSSDSDNPHWSKVIVIIYIHTIADHSLLIHTSFDGFWLIFQGYGRDWKQSYEYEYDTW